MLRAVSQPLEPLHLSLRQEIPSLDPGYEWFHESFRSECQYSLRCLLSRVAPLSLVRVMHLVVCGSHLP